MKQKNLLFVRKPAQRKGVWCVVIATGPGPLAEETEVVKCPGGQEAAYQAYRRIRKEQGKGL